MEDAASQEYVEAVLSYAPVAQWHAIIDHAEKSGKLVHQLLEIDAYFNLFDRNVARDKLQKITGQFGLGEDKGVASSAVGSREIECLLLGLNSWVLQNDCEGAFRHFMRGLEENKRNLFFCKRAQLMGLIGGFNERILEPARLIEEENRQAHFFAGMLVFGYEQADRYQEAEAAAREAINRNEKDGWLDHGYAHSLYFQGKDRIKEATEYLMEKSKLWSLDKMMPFLYTHLWWHYSLVLVESGRPYEAVQVFDSKLWPQQDNQLQKDIQVQINAMELLWKLESLGMHKQTKTRWQAVLEAIKSYSAKTTIEDPLHDVLMIRGYSALGNEGQVTSIVEKTSTKDLKALYTAVAQACSGKESDIKMGRQSLRQTQSSWNILGNSTEQRAVLLELAYDAPVVCGKAQTENL